MNLHEGKNNSNTTLPGNTSTFLISTVHSISVEIRGIVLWKVSLLSLPVVVDKVFDRGKIGIKLVSNLCLSWVQIQIACVGGDKE